MTCASKPRQVVQGAKAMSNMLPSDAERAKTAGLRVGRES